MSVEYLVFSDLHFKPSTLEDATAACTWIASQIVENRPTTTVFCGDLNHTHGYVDIETLTSIVVSMTRVLDACASVGSKFVAVSGNHDQATSDARSNLLSILRLAKGSAIAVEVAPELIGKALYCPYPPDTQEAASAYYNKAVASMDSADIVFAHFDLKGVPYSPLSGHFSSRGVDPSQFSTPLVCGHYHHPATLRENPPSLIVGSPYYFSWADTVANDPRGVLVIYRESGGLRFHRVENPTGAVYATLDASSVAQIERLVAKYGSRLRLRLRASDEGQIDYARTIEGAREVKIVPVGELRSVRSTIETDVALPHTDPMRIVEDFLLKDEPDDTRRLRLLDKAKELLITK